MVLHQKWIVTIVLTFNFGWSFSSAAQEKDSSGNLLQEMIDLVVKYNPSLISQRRLITEAGEVREPWWPPIFNDFELGLTGGYTLGLIQQSQTGGLEPQAFPAAGINLSLPIFNPSRWWETDTARFEVKKARGEAELKYQELEGEVVSKLLEKVTKIAGLEIEKTSKEGLKDFFDGEFTNLERQARLGTSEAVNLVDLWDLKERIIEVDIKLKSIASELKALRMEAAVTLGGDKWKELLDLLNQVKGEI